MDTGSLQDTDSSAVQALTVDAVLSRFDTSRHGLEHDEASKRLEEHGRNSLPEAAQPGLTKIFLGQFTSPLIYVLLVAAIFSAAIGEWSDAGFIAAVLVINGIIGTFQEYSAQRAAVALKNLVTTRCRVLREGDSYEIDAQELVPGDVVLLESGDRIPADLRLIASHDLEVDESLLTGESVSILKNSELVLEQDTLLADRRNMCFAGALVQRGRGRGIVVATGLGTQLGTIAESVLERPQTKAPLLIRLETFTRRIAVIIGISALLMAGVALLKGMPLNEIFLFAVALAVSAIPEGLPVAITVALAIGMRRMAQRHVIIRRLVAVEALGSCTFIATDKTGTLTLNQLTAQRVVFPSGPDWEASGTGHDPLGEVQPVDAEPSILATRRFARLCRVAVLANEGILSHRGEAWVQQGDAVDVALLIMAHKEGITRPATMNAYPELATIPFESERLFSASMHLGPDGSRAFVKGALERILPMCRFMQGDEQDIDLQRELIEAQAHRLATDGFRVLALAEGSVNLAGNEVFSEEHLHELTFVGLVGMIDPLREEARDAIVNCRQAGIEVAMITGDHPVTALAIARQLELATSREEIVTGADLRQAEAEDRLDEVTRSARVYARVEPQQKLGIVQSLQRNGHFVAVSGDGANDAPALQVAHVGVAMGKSGTDVARETADLVLTDDNFASIVAGVEEGRVVYANVRKVVFLLISTGMAELVLFTLALMSGLPLPLLAVQLLWLNLVTNGIQDVALAFEPAEGDELKRPPRSPRDPIFNRLMLERVIISAVLVGVVAYLVFSWLLERGYSIDEARNGTLLLMVLFENIHVLNCRSETRSVFRHNLFSNPFLLFGTLIAQMVHIGAMYTPWLGNVLNVQPVSLEFWLELLCIAMSVLVVMEVHKFVRGTMMNIRRH